MISKKKIFWISEEDRKRVNDLAQTSNRPVDQVVHNLLNDIHEASQIKGKVNNDKTPIITKYICGSFYWRKEGEQWQKFQVLISIL